MCRMNGPSILAASLLLLTLVSCSSDQPDDQRPIGTATMRGDGTLVLQLRAEDPKLGILGDAQFEYPPGHPEYQETLDHLGGLKKGEEKFVPPWPEKEE
jgi:hypothetical protein